MPFRLMGGCGSFNLTYLNNTYAHIAVFHSDSSLKIAVYHSDNCVVVVEFADYDSLFFMSNGLKVVAVDLSSEMVKVCKEKSIETYELDFYNLSSLNKKFDCIYAINTLLHVPKNDLPHVLKEIDSALETNGLFFMGLYGGKDTEDEFVKSEISDSPRFFAFHSESYLKATLKKQFDIIDFETLNIGTSTEVDIFHSIILRKTDYSMSKMTEPERLEKMYVKTDTLTTSLPPLANQQ